MKYLTSKEISKIWNVSERMVRYYCENNKIEGAFLKGKTWIIPEDSIKPTRKTIRLNNELLNILKEEKDIKLKGGIYHKIQIELTYNSNHIEGSRLSEDQTRFIYETNTIGLEDSIIKIDDILETLNHFRCIDFIIDNALKTLNESMIKKLHFILKNNTSDSFKEWFNVGDYKKIPNEVCGISTCNPKDVKKEINNLLLKYNKKKEHSFEDIIEFHKDFECIHPFQDGNGRVGRLIMFKECLKNNIVPFIIDEDHKLFYYRGLKKYNEEKGYLIDTCYSCQDKFKSILDYFKIKY